MIQVSRMRGQEEILLPIGGNEWRSDHFGLILQGCPAMVHINTCPLYGQCSIKHKDVGEIVTKSCVVYSGKENHQVEVTDWVFFLYYH